MQQLSPFKTCAKEITRLWTDYWIPASPHQELIPWVGALRNLTVTNWVWVEYFGNEYRL